MAGDKFMSEMHLRQGRFTYSACSPFTINKERIKWLKKNRTLKIYFYRNELDKPCFQLDTDYGDFKDLNTVESP